MASSLAATPLGASPIRHKRNFKALQLPQAPRKPEPQEISPPEVSASTTRLTPLLGQKKPVAARGPSKPSNATATSTGTGSRRSLQATISNTLAKFDSAKPTATDPWDDADFKNLQELGQGNGGSVMKVEHVPSGMIMAKKVVLIDAKPAVRKQILRELQIMHDCNSKYIVSSYGAYLAEPNICICMEFMDKGSFEAIYKKIGPIVIQVVGKVAHAVLEGLTYLYDVHRIIHRDIKPSNILCNSEGQIKLCDFGVSGELINSIANTFVGTSTYMSPERIQGAEYSVKSDVWSLGITLIELAHGRFPFNESWSDGSDLSDLEEETSNTPAETLSPLPLTPPPPPPQAATDITPSQSLAKPRSAAQRDSLQVSSRKKRSGSASLRPDSIGSPITQSKRSKRRSKGVSLHGGGMTMSIIELMHHIIQEPPPRLGAGRYPRQAEEFVNACLEKEIDTRKTPGVLMEFAWIGMAKESDFDVKAWSATF